MGCGKSLLLECVACLVPRPEVASSITAASIFRVIDDQRPTLLIDEADRVIRGDNPELIFSSGRMAGKSAALARWSAAVLRAPVLVRDQRESASFGRAFSR